MLIVQKLTGIQAMRRIVVIVEPTLARPGEGGPSQGWIIEAFGSQERTVPMNTRSLWIASLSGAVLTTLVSNLPIIGFVNCLVCAGFWGSAIFAVWLYRRLSGTPTVRQGLTIGALTGLFAGVLGFSLSFVGLAGLQGLLNNSEGVLPPDALKGMTDVPAWGALVFNLMGVVFNVVFGALGGWLGAVIFNRNRKIGQEGVSP